VIGGYAVGAHGRPRATKDLDLLLEPLNTDAKDRSCRALEAFGAPRATWHASGRLVPLGSGSVVTLGHGTLADALSSAGRGYVALRFVRHREGRRSRTQA
jgi:hypothetical protein